MSLRTNFVLAATVVALGSMSACGDDQAPATQTTDDQTATPAADSEPSADGPLTVENLADRCESLVPIVTTLRAQPPVEVKESEAKNATGDGFEYRTAHCTFAYEGDDFSDPNRVDVYLDAAPDDIAGLKTHWESIATSEALAAIDGADAATWYTMTGVDAKSSARALVGDSIISVRVAVPKDMQDEVFMSKAALATALQAVVDLR